MNSNNPPSPKRYVLGLQDYWRKVVEGLATRVNNTHNMDGLPMTDEDRLRHVDEMVAAFRNMEGIVDGRVNNPHIEFVESLDEERAQMKAWEYLVEAEVAQGNYRNTTSNVIRADFKDFTTRWKMIVASMRICKAAVYNAFQPSITERFVNNPATELNTKLSNLYTNAAKAVRQKIATEVEKHGSASFNKTTRELKDSQGEVLAVFPKPVKRKLADVLGPELASHAKVKRARRPRQARTQASITNNAGNLVSDNNVEDADEELVDDEDESDNDDVDNGGDEADNSEFDDDNSGVVDHDYGYGDYDSEVAENDRDGDDHNYGNQSNAGSANGHQQIDTSFSSSFPSQRLDLNHQLGSESGGHAGAGSSFQNYQQHQDYYPAMNYQNSMANHQADSPAQCDFAEDFSPHHHGNQVGGPAGVGSSSQSHHHGYRGYPAQFPVASLVYNQESGGHQGYVGGGFEGPLSNALGGGQQPNPTPRRRNGARHGSANKKS